MTGLLLVLGGLAQGAPEGLTEPDVAVLGAHPLRVDNWGGDDVRFNGGVQVRSKFVEELPAFFVQAEWRAIARAYLDVEYAVHDVRLGAGGTYPALRFSAESTMIQPYLVYAAGGQFRWAQLGGARGGSLAAWGSVGGGVALGGEVVRVLIEAQADLFTNFRNDTHLFDVAGVRTGYATAGGGITSAVGVQVRPRARSD